MSLFAVHLAWQLFFIPAIHLALDGDYLLVHRGDGNGDGDFERFG
jgi:hypothetical protein